MLAFVVTLVLYAVQFGLAVILFGSALAARSKQGRGPFIWPVFASFFIACGLVIKLVRGIIAKKHNYHWGRGLVILEVLGTMLVNFADIFLVATTFHLWQHRRRVLMANHPRKTKAVAAFMWIMVSLTSALNIVGSVISLIESRRLTRLLNKSKGLISWDRHSRLLIAGSAWVCALVIWVLSVLSAIIASQILYWQTKPSRDKVTRILAWGVSPLFALRLMWLIANSVFLKYGEPGSALDGLSLFFNTLPNLFILALYLYLGLSNKNLDMWSLPKRSQSTNQYVQLNNQSDVLLAKS